MRFKTKIAKEFAQKENGNNGVVPVQVKRSVNFELDDEKVGYNIAKKENDFQYSY